MELGKNYTKPHDINHVDKSEDWLKAALVFVKSLSYLLEQNEGICIHLENDMKLLFPNVDKVIVYKSDTQVKILECNKDLKDGQMVKW